MTAGSLGQGFSCAVGMALGSRLEDDGVTVYALLGDGESQEGQIWESAMFAASKKLDNLIAFTDYNKLQSDGTVAQINDLAPLGAIPAECNLSFDFPLMTVDEFFALPGDVLSHVREIGFFGNYVMKDPWGELWLEEDWDGGDKPDLYIHDNATGERFPIGEGSITDLAFLNRLPNLETLYLYGQPIESLGGIEAAAKLRWFQTRWSNLSDLSPLFDL
jgi:hypothetical protein